MQPADMPLAQVPVVLEPMDHRRAPPVYEFARVRTINDGESPGDILLAECRYWFDLVTRERGKPRPNKKRLAELWERARDSAKAAAPWVHTKLAALRFTADLGGSGVNWNTEMLMSALAALPAQELEALERIYTAIGTAAGPARSGPGRHPEAEAPARG